MLPPGAFVIKLLTAIHIHPSLTFAGKPRSLQVEWSPIKDSTWVDFSLERKYYNRVKVTDSNKHCSLLRYEINNGRKKIYEASPAQAGHIKLFCSVCYALG
jgi:hypothetical protein